MREVKIENLNGIDSLSIPLNIGRVVVLEGANGSGKSGAIDAVQAFVEKGAGRAEPSYGREFGQISGLGATMRVGRRQSRNGELEVQSGGIDPSRFIDPGLKSEEAADAARVRELLNLAGVAIDDAEWVAHLGGQPAWDAIAQPKTLAERDPVERAARLKADLHKAAQGHESRRDVERGKADAIAAQIAAVDATAPHDATALADQRRQAELELARIKAERTSAAGRSKRYEAARAAITEAEQRSGSSGVDSARAALAQADGALAQAVTQHDDAVQIVQNLRNQLRDAEAALSNATRSMESARHARTVAAGSLQNAEAAESSLAAARKVLDAGIGEPGPTADDQAAAEAAVRSAMDAEGRGAVIRAALARKSERDAADAEANRHDSEAARLRECAKSIDDVLTRAIQRAAPRGIVWVDGRLKVPHRGGLEFISKLSEGERTKLALEICADKVGSGGLVMLAQRYWEALDPDRQADVVSIVSKLPITILTAQCRHGGALRVDIPEPAKAPAFELE